MGSDLQAAAALGNTRQRSVVLDGARWLSADISIHRVRPRQRSAALTLSIASVVSLALVTGGPPSGVLEALDTVTEDGAPIYFAREGLTARAMDLVSGAELWQVALPDVDKVQAAVLHKLAPYRLLHQGSGRCLSFDTTRGYSPVGADRRREPSRSAAAGPAGCAQPASVDRLRRRAPARSGATRTRRQRDVGWAR